MYRTELLGILVFTLSIGVAVGATEEIIDDNYEFEKYEIMIITNIVKWNKKSNGWNTIILSGQLPDSLFLRLGELGMAFTITDSDRPDVKIKDVIPYHSNTIIVKFANFTQFEKAVRRVTSLLYWHPLANIILFYEGTLNELENAKFFFILWYFKGINVIILQRDLSNKRFIVSAYNPYMTEHSKLEQLFGCWTTKRLGFPMKNLAKGIECVEKCHNISFHSSLRANNLGTCLGLDTYRVPFEDVDKQLVLFEDKVRNLHGYTFHGISLEVLPFLKVTENSNGTYTLQGRDGLIWISFAEYLNCSVDLSSASNLLKNEFNYETNIQQLFAFSQRKADLLMFPVYQFDLIIAQVDYTFPFAESGVCFVARHAGFEMTIFDAKLLQDNINVAIEFLICFVGTWFVLFIFNMDFSKSINFDQAGRDFVDACKLVLSISIRYERKRRSFRVFLAIAICGFFAINFSTQAAIISLFSVYKRGKNIDTFEDILENIRNNNSFVEGIPSPDVTLPSADERVNIITANMRHKLNIFECIDSVKNDSRRICLTDCTVGRYLERSLLDEYGRQYLHVAEKDRIHSLYLNMLFQRHSPLTEHFNKYIMAIFESGILKKWMEYKYQETKDEIPFKVLGVHDLTGIFQIYMLLAGISFMVFIVEVCLGFRTCL